MKLFRWLKRLFATPTPPPIEPKILKEVPFKLGSRSLKRLNGVQPDLVAVVKLAIQISSIDFTVLEGLRTKKQQRENVRKGVSQTMNSKHLTGRAVDLAPFPVAPPSEWSTVKETRRFRGVGHAMLRAAQMQGTELVWGATKKHGGHWRTFNDMPHFEVQP